MKQKSGIPYLQLSSEWYDGLVSGNVDTVKVSDFYRWLLKKGYPAKISSLSNPLKNLVSEGKLVVSRRGKGRLPSIFKVFSSYPYNEAVTPKSLATVRKELLMDANSAKVASFKSLASNRKQYTELASQWHKECVAAGIQSVETSDFYKWLKANNHPADRHSMASPFKKLVMDQKLKVIVGGRGRKPYVFKVLKEGNTTYRDDIVPKKFPPIRNNSSIRKLKRG